MRGGGKDVNQEKDISIGQIPTYTENITYEWTFKLCAPLLITIIYQFYTEDEPAGLQLSGASGHRQYKQAIKYVRDSAILMD